MSRSVRRCAVAGAAVLLFLSLRVAFTTFGVSTTLSDGAKAYATCKAPWQSVRISNPAHRYTLWVMTGGTGTRKEEGVLLIGARCRYRAERRTIVAVVLLAGGGALAGLALRRTRPDPA
ncbi:MAG TPA: hypothetical protein VHL53_05310 [Acidimicrobiia bacterium]|nr:hypothetical protein [Acidimicrobiia bacterium]